MTREQKESKDQDKSYARRRRHTTKPKVPVPPKFPKAVVHPLPPLSHVLRHLNASSLVEEVGSFGQGAKHIPYILPRPPQFEKFSSVLPKRTPLPSGLPRLPIPMKVESLDTPCYGPDGKAMAPPAGSVYFPDYMPVTRETSASPPTSSDESDDTHSPSFVNTVNTFGLKLLSHAMDPSPNKPAGLCPLNIYHCLSMVAAGSKDDILAAFGKVLDFTPKPFLLDTMTCNTINLDHYSKTSSAVSLYSASGIFPDRLFKVEKAWKSTILETFESEIGAMEVGAINEFIERETKGKFKNLVQPQDLEGQLLMLVTCLYFKAKWASPFNKTHTEPNATFFGYDGENMTCNMMSKCAQIEYIEDTKYQVAILPYKWKSEGPMWEAAIVLPKQRGVKAMRDLLASFTTSPDNLRNLLMGYGAFSIEDIPRSVRVDLDLPRFSIKLNLDLKPALEKLGLGPAFQPSNDFAPISRDGLFISRATHDLFLEVSEEGTEVFAVTRIPWANSSIQKPKKMNVDHPFLFIVFDAATGLVLAQAVVSEI